MAKIESGNPKDKITAKIFHSRWMKAVSVMAGIVVFCTTYALILPAITMSAQDAKCGYEEHTHAAECYDAEGNIICGIEEHVHSLECYSDLYADIENPDEWSAEIPALSGERNANVVDVAWSQIGYRESDSNYLVSDGDQTQGYTRYGHWYGDVIDGSGERLENGLSSFAYADWDAMFVSFVLDNAGVYDFGYDYDAGNWAGALAAAGRYTDAADYIPEAGDLIFFTPEAGAGIKVGIVTDVNKGFLGMLGDEVKSISVIVGNSNNSVEEIKVAVADYNEGDVVFEKIHGYGILTPKEEVMDESVSSDVLTSDQAEAELGVQEEVPVEEAAEQTGEGVSEEQTVTEESEATDTSESEYVTDITDDNNHIIGADAEDLETVEITENEGVRVTVGEATVSDDSETIVMNWQVDAQLDAGLSAGSIIRVDTASGKEHALTVAELKAWGGIVRIGEEDISLVDSEEFEVIFIGSNGHLYTWADVQSMDDGAVTTFNGLHVKVLGDVAIEDGSLSFGFESTAKIADANAGQNYYVTRVSINEKAGSATFTFKNGEAVPVDQNKILQDAGIDAFTNRTYVLTAKGEDYTVTMSYGTDAEIPDVAKLKVTEIREGTKAFDNYITEAKVALGLDEDDELELSGRFFDIKIMTKNGEFEPKAPVSVNISYDSAIKDVDSERVSAIHFDDGTAEEVAVETSVVDGDIEAVNFEAESFSVYGIVYTVDFAYEDYMYTLDGGEQILLSELMFSLGLKADIKDVTDVTFTNEALISIQKNGTDWTIRSLQSFDSEEKLSITMNDGTVYDITVTDPPAQTTRDLNSLASEATITIDGVKYDHNDTWSLRPGEQYSVGLSFAENRRTQFANNTVDSPLVYDVPAGFTMSEDSLGGTFTIDLGIDGLVEGNTWTYNKSTNQIYVRWNTESPNYSKLTDAGNAEFSINIKGSFDVNQDKIDFGDGAEVTIEEDTTHNAAIKKDGYYDVNTNKIMYTLTVTSTGSTEDIVVKDDIYGTALKFDDNLTLTSNKGSTVTYNNYVPSDNGFTLTIPSMSNGEIITIEYSASVDVSKIAVSGNATVQETGNGVKITPKVDDVPDDNTSSHYESSISYSDMSKVATQVSDSYVRDGKTYKTITWKVTTNAHQVASIANSTITDKITQPNNMVYSGDGLDITVTNEAGTTTTRHVAWDDLENHESQTWTYKVPATDGKFKYEIEYTTEVEITGLTKNIDAKNTSTGKGGSADASTGVGPDGDGVLPVTKSATDVNIDEVTWTVTVNVDKAGYSRFVVKDYLPAIYGNNIGVYSGQWYPDTYIENSLQVEGLVGNEWYLEPTFSTETNYSRIDGQGGITCPVMTIEFIKDKETQEKGLTATDTNRTLTLTFKTKNNETWIENTRDRTDYTTKHVNDVKVTTPTSVGEAEATAIPVESYVDKSLGTGYNGDAQGTTTINGVELPYYRYDVVIANVKSDKLYIQDSFNDEILRVWSENTDYRSMKVYGGDAAAQYGNGGAIGSIEYVELAGQHYLYVDKFPKKPDGTFFSHYRISYYLIVKDATALEKLNNMAIKNKGTVNLTNTATWETEGDSETVTYKYKAVNKEITSYDPVTRKVSFTVTINPEKKELNNGNDMTLTDTFTNLSIDYQSIHADCDPAANRSKVYWDYSDNVGTYNIPDKTKVTLTYIGIIKGDKGDSVKFGNEAKMLGYSDTAGDTKTLESDAGGSASNYRLRLFKYEYKNMTIGLEGAVFQLYEAVFDDNNDETGMNPVTFENSGTSQYACSDANGTNHNHNEGDFIYFSTGSDGYVTVELSQERDGVWLEKDKKYYLIEVKEPEGYLKSTTAWNFEISSNADYDNVKNAYRYYNNDILKVGDTKPGKIVLKKTFSNNSMLYDENLTEAQKQQIVFKVYDGKEIKTDETTGAVTNLIATISYAEFVDGSFTLAHPEYNIQRDYTYYVVEESTVSSKSLITTYTVNGTALDATATGAEVVASDLSADEEETNKVEVENEYEIETTDISATKAWKNADGTITAPANGYVVFTLYADGVATSQTVTLDGVVDENGELTQWVATFPELPKYKNVDGNDVEIAYTVRETQGWTNYNADVESVTNGGTITNEEIKKGALKFTKEVTVDGDTPSGTYANEEHIYTFKVTGPGDDGDVEKTVEIKVKGNTVMSAKVDNADVSVIDNYIVIPDLYVGEYTITETKPTDGTVISKIDDTATTVNYAKVTVKAGDTTAVNASVKFTNDYDLTDVNVTKQWKNRNSQPVEWDESVASITLSLSRKKGDVEDSDFGTVTVVANSSGITSITPAISGVTGSVTLKTDGTPSDGYVITLSGLPANYYADGEVLAYEYYFAEEQVEFYKEPAYFASGGGEVINAEAVASGGSIVNTPEDAYDLPETGGVGTLVYTLSGLILIVYAVVLYISRNKVFLR